MKYIYYVLRGGSFYYLPQYCRCSARLGDIPLGRHYDGGFRVVKRIKTTS